MIIVNDKLCSTFALDLLDKLEKSALYVFDIGLVMTECDTIC